MKCLVINFKKTIFIFGFIILLALISLATVAGIATTSDNPIRRLPIYCVETNEKKVAVTFDAAWGSEDTDEIIDILNTYNAKATFFVIGKNAKETTEAPKQNGNPKQQVAPTKKSDAKGVNKETNNKKVPSNNGRNEAPKPAPTKKPEAPKPEEKVTKEVKQPKPQTIILQKDEIVAPRVDEETLNKYSHFLDDDEYNITRENRTKKNSYGNKENESSRRKKNVKNNKNNKEILIFFDIYLYQRTPCPWNPLAL